MRVGVRSIGATAGTHAARLPRSPLLPNAMMGMLIFVCAELMLFAGFVSAFSIMRESALVWPPPGQPRLPVTETAINTVALLASGVALLVALRAHRRHAPDARRPLFLSALLGGFFVLAQGREWVRLLAAGLTLRSSALGSFFYVIVGVHAIHAVVAIGLIIACHRRLVRGWLPADRLGATAILWAFVVGVWPVLYWRLYLG